MNFFKEMHPYAKKYYPFVVLHFFLGVVSITAGMLMPQAAQLLIDDVLIPALGGEFSGKESAFSFLLEGTGDTEFYKMFFILSAAIGVCAIIRHLQHYIRWNMAHSFGVGLEKKLRIAAFNKIINQNSVVLNRYTSGELLGISNSDAIVSKDAYSHFIPLIFDQFFAIGLAAYFLSRINGYLIIAPACLGLVLLVRTFLYIKKMREIFKDIRVRSVELNSCVQENINGVKIVRAFAAEEYEIQKFDKKNTAYRDAFFRHAECWSINTAVFSALAQGINLVSVILGVIFALGGKMSVGEFATFLAYVYLINNPMVLLANFLGGLQQSMVCGNRIFTFMKTSNVITDKPDAARIVSVPNIRFVNVTVQIDDTELIKNISLDLPYGKKLGVMGATGSGKSALLKTFARFFEVSGGELYINGVSIKNLAIDDVRRQYSYVLQDVFLFSNTVDSNIAFYDPDAPKERVIECASIAEADGFIRKLPDGYETIIGERGLGLSGGQRQRVSIARALLKDAPVIMLDDCTSALDLHTERNILANIKESYPDRSLIIASHRAGSVMDCDEIIYLEGGVIAERGTHSELMEKQGHYYHIFNKQAAAQREVLG